MKYEALLKAYGSPRLITECVSPEKHVKDSVRAGFSMEKKKNHVVFRVKASDSVALRATLNSITKMLTVYENTNAFADKNE